MTDALAEAVTALREATDRLAEKLPRATPEELTAYVAERDRCIGAIRAAAETADASRLAAWKPAVEEVLAKEALIVRRMEKLRDEAAGKLKQAALAKAQRSAYEPTVPADSYFFDRKK